MQKNIKFSDGKVLSMTYEEVRVRFMPMLVRMMNSANNKFIYNAVEKDDFKQIMEIELWKAFEQYDPEMNICFSTFLYPKMKKGIRDATYHKYSLKNQGTNISMNAPMGDDDLKLEDMFASEDDSMSNLEVNELQELIIENIDEDEKEVLQILLDKQNFTVQTYADKYGISRQAANQRVIKLKKKLQVLVSEKYLGIA